MEIISEQKYILLSPRKVRPVVDLIKKLTPSQALEKLPFVKNKAADYLSKVIKSAIANANQKELDANKLIFKEIQIVEGPRLKRGQPVSRGRWHPIKKRMSHIKVVLTVVKELTLVSEKEAKKETEKKDIETKKISKAVKKERKVEKNGTKS